VEETIIINVGVTAALLLAVLLLAAQSVKIVSPNGDESLALNTAHDITWTSQSSGAEKMDIILPREGARIGYVKRNVELSAGRWAWTRVGKLDDGSAVPAATDYQIRIRDAGGAFHDNSDRNFAIGADKQVIYMKDSAMAPHYPYIVFDAYLYDSGGTLLDARSEKR